jgi:hypothetical protein
MNAINTNEVNAVKETERFNISITAIAGSEEAKESATLWTGRQVGKAPRKDLQLTQALPQISAATIAALDAEKVALILNDEFMAYVRRVKCQRMEIGNITTLAFPINEVKCAAMMVNMLSAPATRVKKLVSTSSIRAMLLSSEYREAAALVMGDKLDAWKRVGEREMLPLATAQDAKIATNRAKVRDTAIVRCMEIAALMPAGDNRLVLEAAAELLADIEVADLDDSI